MTKRTLRTGRPVTRRLPVPGLAECRLAKGLSCEQLARKLPSFQVIGRAVSEWERCLSNPPAEVVAELAGVLGVSEEKLYGGKKK